MESQTPAQRTATDPRLVKALDMASKPGDGFFSPQWYEWAARLLRHRELHMTACRGGDCSRTKPCDACQANIEWLRIEYEENNRLAPELKRFRDLARQYPDEVRDILAPMFVDFMQHWESSRGE